MTTAQAGGRVVSLTFQPPLPQEMLLIFLLDAESTPRAIVRSERLYVKKKSNDTSCDRTNDLPICNNNWSRYRSGVAQRVGRGISLLSYDSGTRRWWVVSSTPRPQLTPGKDPVPIVQEAGWALGPVWTVAENLDTTRIRSPDRPGRSQSLYRLSYRGPHTTCHESLDCIVMYLCISPNSVTWNWREIYFINYVTKRCL